MTGAIPGAKSPSGVENTDPVLVKLAETGTFDVPWEDLRHSLYLGLMGALPVFMEKGQPATYSGLIMIEPAPSPTSGEPSWTERDDGIMRREENPELSAPSHGTYIIPPFPPLDMDSRRKSREARENGTTKHPFDDSKNPYEDDWDEESIIGGRKLPGWLEEEEAKKEVDQVAKNLEALSFAPFTVQRLAELLIAPTRLHSTLGKFLRAVEKMLNVSTPYAPPSYVYVPPPPLLMDGSPEPAPRRDLNSTVPLGSMTPLFSPIPFLPSQDMELGESMMDHGEGGGAEDGLMSPLMLESGSVFGQQQGSRRSPTPEPEEDAEMAEPSNPDSNGDAGNDSNGDAPENLGHQPYLGRVDELDAGPITSNGHDEDEDIRGVGERGGMAPHGMSERPVPLSSTTVISDEEREIAPLPRSASQVDVGKSEKETETTEGEEKTETEGTKAEDDAEEPNGEAMDTDAVETSAATSAETPEVKEATADAATEAPPAASAESAESVTKDEGADAESSAESGASESAKPSE